MTRETRLRALTAAALAGIVVLAAALRLAGLYWGLPDALHPDYSYHPDEIYLVRWARWLVAGIAIPKHFIFGGTLYYSVLNAYHFFAPRLDAVLDGYNALADTMLLGRYVSVAFSLATIALLYQVGRDLFGRAVGVLAALLLAIAPAHAFLAQNVRPDALATFMALLIVYLAIPIARAEPGRDGRRLALLGLLLGAAVALRFPLAAFGAAPLAAFLLRDRTRPPPSLRAAWTRRIAAIAAAALAGYAVTSPHTFFYPQVLLKGLADTWSFETEIFVDAVGRGPGVYQYGWLALRDALGDGVHLLALGGIALALTRRTDADLIAVAALVPYFLLLASVSWVVVRYTLPILPILALLAAALVVRGLESMRWRRATAAAAVAALAWTVIADLAFVGVQSGVNVRDEATAWIRANVEPTTFATLWDYDHDRYFNPVIPEPHEHRPFTLAAGADLAALTAAGAPEYLVVNETEYKNMERLGDRHPRPEVVALQALLASGRFERIGEFHRPVRFLGIDASSRFTSQDYAMINPGIRIYRRRAEPAP